MLSQSTWT